MPGRAESLVGLVRCRIMLLGWYGAWGVRWVTGARCAANAFGEFVTAFKVQRAQSMEQPASSGKRGRGEG